VNGFSGYCAAVDIVIAVEPFGSKQNLVVLHLTVL
jgi:hypothetical protein